MRVGLEFYKWYRRFVGVAKEWNSKDIWSPRKKILPRPLYNHDPTLPVFSRMRVVWHRPGSRGEDAGWNKNPPQSSTSVLAVSVKLEPLQAVRHCRRQWQVTVPLVYVFFPRRFKTFASVLKICCRYLVRRRSWNWCEAAEIIAARAGVKWPIFRSACLRSQLKVWRSLCAFIVGL